MTREEYRRRKHHDYAGVNDGSITPELKGWYWTLYLDPAKGTTLVHARTIEALPTREETT
jgi:hypothetical protein